MAERKSGPVKPPVIDLKARDASQQPEAETAATQPEPTTSAAPKARPAAGPKPEAVRPVTPPATPTPPVRQAKLAMPWSAISIAAIGGALLGTALTYVLVNLIPMPSNAPVIADPSDRLTALESRLGTLDSRIPALEEGTLAAQAGIQTATTQSAAALDELRANVAALETRLGEVQGSIPEATTVDLAPITTQLDTLEARVTAIAAGASSADAAALAQSLNGIETSLAGLTARIDAADQRLGEIDGIRTELATAKAAIAAQTQTLGGANIGPAVKLPLVVSGLETAFTAGRPYAAELDSLKALLPDLTVPESVSAAASTGLSRADALASAFSGAVPAILASRAAQSTGDWGKDAIEWAKGLLAIRPTGEMAGNTPEAIVSRLEGAIGRRDFVAAAALLDQLPEPMQAAAAPVAADIRTHAQADGFLAGLRAQALAPVAEPAP